MKTGKQNNKTENQELREWKKPELKVLDTDKTNSGGGGDPAEDHFYDS
ncbi:MAG: hypothetical protein R6U04_03230 [Bacteroidales bacterium]